MAWYSFLTSSDKVVDNLLDKDKGLLTQVGNWIGNMNYTEEERMEGNALTVKAASEFVQATLSENTTRSKTRRKLALVWVYTEIFLVLLTVAVAPASMPLAAFYWQIAMSDIMFYGTLTVLSFFFGSHMLNGLSNKIKPSSVNIKPKN